MQTIMISASKIRTGNTLVDIRNGFTAMRVVGVRTCNDGSLRITTNLGEQRMTGSIMVRVLH